MSKKLKSFPVNIISPKVVMDENNQYRIGKTAVDENNNLCIRYCLPKNKQERLSIKKSLADSVPQLTVYE